MSRVRTTKIHRLITRALASSGLDYRIDTTGKKHRKLYIEGRMVMVFSHGACGSKDIGLLNSFIRRAQEAKNADHPRAV